MRLSRSQRRTGTRPGTSPTSASRRSLWLPGHSRPARPRQGFAGSKCSRWRAGSDETSWGISRLSRLARPHHRRQAGTPRLGVHAALHHDRRLRRESVAVIARCLAAHPPTVPFALINLTVSIIPLSCCPRASRIPGSSRMIPDYPGLKLGSCLRDPPRVESNGCETRPVKGDPPTPVASLAASAVTTTPMRGVGARMRAGLRASERLDDERVVDHPGERRRVGL